MNKLSIFGTILIFASLICVNFSNYGMRSGLTTLATHSMSSAETPQPGDIADDMFLNSTLGFLASGIGFLGLAFVVFGSRQGNGLIHPKVSD